MVSEPNKPRCEHDLPCFVIFISVKKHWGLLFQKISIKKYSGSSGRKTSGLTVWQAGCHKTEKVGAYQNNEPHLNYWYYGPHYNLTHPYWDDSSSTHTVHIYLKSVYRGFLSTRLQWVLISRLALSKEATCY